MPLWLTDRWLNPNQVQGLGQFDRELAKAVEDINQADKAKPMTITGHQPGAIKARLEALREAAQSRREAAMNKVAAADAKAASVDAELERVAAQIEKEADDALQEFAPFTNGDPTKS